MTPGETVFTVHHQSHSLPGKSARRSDWGRRRQVTWCAARDKPGWDIFDAMNELFRHTMKLAEDIANASAVSLSWVNALHHLDDTISMKELGKRLRCDPSFVTTIADSLENVAWSGANQMPPTAVSRIWCSRPVALS